MSPLQSARVLTLILPADVFKLFSKYFPCGTALAPQMEHWLVIPANLFSRCKAFLCLLSRPWSWVPQFILALKRQATWHRWCFRRDDSSTDRYLNGYSMLNVISAGGEAGGSGRLWKAGVCFQHMCRACKSRRLNVRIHSRYRTWTHRRATGMQGWSGQGCSDWVSVCFALENVAGDPSVCLWLSEQQHLALLNLPICPWE